MESFGHVANNIGHGNHFAISCLCLRIPLPPSPTPHHPFSIPQAVPSIPKPLPLFRLPDLGVTRIGFGYKKGASKVGNNWLMNLGGTKSSDLQTHVGLVWRNSVFLCIRSFVQSRPGVQLLWLFIARIRR